MLPLLQQFIQKNQLFNPQTDKILLALSGGRDSCLLLYLFLELRIKVGLAHCNFQLRGQESERDQVFCEELAAAYGLELHIGKFDTAEYAQIHKLSTQEAARTLRYGYFEQLRTAKNYQFVATAHHLSDSIETVLLNLGKGCGIRGLHGILPKQNFIIRPLLFATQAQIWAYVAAKNIAFVEDSSNTSDKYSRNFVRHHIVPKFCQIYPSFEPTFGDNIQRFGQVEQLYAWAANYWAEKAIFIPKNTHKNEQEPLNISLDGKLNPKHSLTELLQKLGVNGDFFCINTSILELAPAPATLLHEWLHIFGFNPQQTEEMAHKNTQIGAIWSSHSHQISKEKTRLLVQSQKIAKFNPKTTAVAENFQFIAHSWADFPLRLSENEILTVEFLPTEANIADENDYLNPNSPKKIYINPAKIQFPLTIRHLRAGDRIQPAGMEGKSKKVADLLKDAGVKNTEKSKIWLLESNNQLAAVLNLRVSHAFMAKNDEFVGDRLVFFIGS